MDFQCVAVIPAVNKSMYSITRIRAEIHLFHLFVINVFPGDLRFLFVLSRTVARDVSRRVIAELLGRCSYFEQERPEFPRFEAELAEALDDISRAVRGKRPALRGDVRLSKAALDAELEVREVLRAYASEWAQQPVTDVGPESGISLSWP